MKNLTRLFTAIAFFAATQAAAAQDKGASPACKAEMDKVAKTAFNEKGYKVIADTRHLSDGTNTYVLQRNKRVYTSRVDRIATTPGGYGLYTMTPPAPVGKLKG